MKNFIFIIVVIVLTAFVVGGGVYWWQKSDAERQMVELKNRILDLETREIKDIQSKTAPSSSVPTPVALPSQTQKTTGADCPLGLRAGQCNQDANKYLHLLTPNGGENLCLDKNFNIRWEHKGMKSVAIYVSWPNGRLEIGNYPADFNETGKRGSGEVVWSPDIDEGYTYEIIISSATDGYLYSDISNKVFSIINCEG